MKKAQVKIRLITIVPQTEEEITVSLFDEDFDEGELDGDEVRLPYDFEDAVIMKMEEDEASGIETGNCEMSTIAEYVEDGSLVYFNYDESELTGMEGTKTSIVFDKNNPGVVSILRSGSVKSAFILEEGVRHTSVYKTQFMPFEICVYTKTVDNSVTFSGKGSLPNGEIYLDYIVELKGMSSQRTRLLIKIG